MKEYKLEIVERVNKSDCLMLVNGPALIDYMRGTELLSIFRKEGVDFIHSDVIDILESPCEVITVIITDDNRLFARREA